MNIEFPDGVKILVPVGSLGAGVREHEVAYGLAQGAHAIACDAGSTDSGAAYLATGKSKNNRAAVRRDLEILMLAQKKAAIPIIVGTCGQAGGNINLDWTRDIVLELANELGMTPKIALLRSEQDRNDIKRLNREGKVRPLPPLGPLTDDTIDQCDHIVAALGVEPYLEALEAGADIILGGRSTDTAVLACFAIWKGAPWGAAWHAGKIGECGAQCTTERESSGVLLTVTNEGFGVGPLSEDNSCTTESVSAHMLYENTDPFRLIEPGGILDVTRSRYRQADPRHVFVTGSEWEKTPYTLKLEGAGGGKFQTIMIVGVQDPDVLVDVEGFHDRLLKALYDRTRRAIPANELGDFHISLRMYGWNGSTGRAVPKGTPLPPEIGMLFVATAETQDIANSIAHACNPYFFHYPAVMDKELPSYGFAFTPADIPRGQVYEFKLNHVLDVDDWREFVTIEWATAAAAAHEMEAANG